jgi:hypothetical protein
VVHTQSCGLVLATGEIIFADGHTEHVVKITPSEYVPELQAVHGELFILSYPGTHMQSVALVPPPKRPLWVFEGHSRQTVDPAISEYVPGGHMEQSPRPTSSLYVPGEHFVHSTPSAPLKPAGQMQSSSAVLADIENALRGHDKQVSSEVAASVDENLPGPQA